MGPSGKNRWLEAYARTAAARRAAQDAAKPVLRRQPLDLFDEMEALAAAAWEAWTPAKSVDEAFRERLAAYFRAHYRRRAED